MTPEEFQYGVRRTEAPFYSTNDVSLSAYRRLVHAALGLADESGEFAKQVKSTIFYGEPLDRVNAIEEIGDVLWYAALALEALGSSLEEAMMANARKLEARYPGRFTSKMALDRDLQSEREVIEDEIDRLNGEAE